MNSKNESFQQSFQKGSVDSKPVLQPQSKVKKIYLWGTAVTPTTTATWTQPATVCQRIVTKATIPRPIILTAARRSIWTRTKPSNWWRATASRWSTAPARARCAWRCSRRMRPPCPAINQAAGTVSTTWTAPCPATREWSARNRSTRRSQFSFKQYYCRHYFRTITTFPLFDDDRPGNWPAKSGALDHPTLPFTERFWNALTTLKSLKARSWTWTD